MQKIAELSERLKQHFPWHKTKRDCLVGALLGMLKKESVNLNDIAIGFPSEAKIESFYRRLQRLIHDYIDFDAFAIFGMALFLFMDGDGYYLTLDRTKNDQATVFQIKNGTKNVGTAIKELSSNTS